MKTIFVSDLPELANKHFESIKDLEKAEAEVIAKQEAKKNAAAVRKTESDKVKEAIVAAYNVEVEVKQAKAALAKEYLGKIEALDKKVEEASRAKAHALEEFCNKYPDGYHDTVKLGEATYRYDYRTNSSEDDTPAAIDFFKKFFLF